MLSIRIPQAEGELAFSVAGRMVLVAGSRHLDVGLPTCRDLLEGFHHGGFHFFVGCARGVDESFRRALSESSFSSDGFVACAFPSRAKRERARGLFARVVVPKGLHPKAALRRRTLWMVGRCALTVLFPQSPFDGSWGPGSRLVFRSCLYHLKPLFVVSAQRPKDSVHYRTTESELFGVVRGWWVVPEGGPCDDEA